MIATDKGFSPLNIINFGGGGEEERAHSTKEPQIPGEMRSSLGPGGAAEILTSSAVNLFIYFIPRYMTFLFLRQPQQPHHTASLLKAEPGNWSLICIFIST